MRQLLVVLTAGTFFLNGSLAAQDPDAVTRWADATLPKLARFLPDASSFGFSPDVEPVVQAFANETTRNNVGSKYPSLVVNKTWWFDDAELSRQLEEVKKEKEALKQEGEAALQEFQRVHGAEMKALEKAHNAQMEALSRQAADLASQGKYEQAGAIGDKITAFHYPAFDALVASLNKKQEKLTERESSLLNRRRKVTFTIYTNRTPSTTAPAFQSARPIGTLAGHTLYRNDQGTQPWFSLVDLAVFVGPSDFQNPKINLDKREPRVKCIVVWAWIQSHPDTLPADEAKVKKVLATIDYDDLAKVIEP